MHSTWALSQRYPSPLSLQLCRRPCAGQVAEILQVRLADKAPRQGKQSKVGANQLVRFIRPSERRLEFKVGLNHSGPALP